MFEVYKTFKVIEEIGEVVVSETYYKWDNPQGSYIFKKQGQGDVSCWSFFDPRTKTWKYHASSHMVIHWGNIITEQEANLYIDKQLLTEKLKR